MAMETFGRMAFYIGLIISVVAGWVQIGGTGLMVLAVLGIVVGLLNVTGMLQVSLFETYLEQQ